jgi:integrase
LPIYIKFNTDNLYYKKDERQIIENAAFALDENGEYVYRYGPAIILMMYTGMRASEATALTWHDINFKEKLIDINKSALTVKENGRYVIVNTYGGKTSCSIRNIPIIGYFVSH